MRPAKIFLQTSALHHNLKIVRQLAPHSKVIAMVKANAYGHGLKQVGKILRDVDAFGVACVEEALILRAAGIQQNIILMEGFFTKDELPVICQQRFEMVIHSPYQLEILAQQSIGQKFNVWLKVNTGMHRLGFPAEDTLAVWQQLRAMPQIKQLRLMTHFSDSDIPQHETVKKQFFEFEKVTAGLTGERSLANSAAIIGIPQTHADWIRPGIMLYGVSPFADNTGLDLQLRPAMTFYTEIIAIQSVKKGAYVGYGSTWQSPHDTRVAVIAAGYGDGYPRDAPVGTPVLVNETIAPLSGRVSMDMLTVDLKNLPAAKIGDPVILWGRGLPVENVARYLGRFSYELLCAVADRVRRVVVE